MSLLSKFRSMFRSTTPTIPADWPAIEQKVSRYEVYQAIDGERNYQEGWRDPTLTDTGGKHTVQEFLTYIQCYTEEAITVGCKRPDPVAKPLQLHALRKIAALAVSAMEQHGVEYRDLKDNLKERHP